MERNLGVEIIRKAGRIGADMAGIASVESLKNSPSHRLLEKIRMKPGGIGFAPGATEQKEIRWPDRALSALVVAVHHPGDKPEMDRWEGDGGTPGNSLLIRITGELSQWIETAYDIRTHPLPYHIENGGICLKDAGVMAGFGCVGRNNLLITPRFGSRVRLRVMLIEAPLTPTGPVVFDPCRGCEGWCRKACPRNAFDISILSPLETGIAELPGRDGCFSRARCRLQMDRDVADSGICVDQKEVSGGGMDAVKGSGKSVAFCRRCELACPVGKGA